MGKGGSKNQEKTANVFYAFPKEEFLKWKCIVKQRYNAKKVLLLKSKQIQINNRFLRERGMVSTPKMEYQVFLCIFQKNSAMATLGC